MSSSNAHLIEDEEDHELTTQQYYSTESLPKRSRTAPPHPQVPPQENIECSFSPHIQRRVSGSAAASCPLESFEQAAQETRKLASKMITQEAVSVNKRLINHLEASKACSKANNKRIKLEESTTEAITCPQQQQQQQQEMERREQVLWHQAHRSRRMISLLHQMEDIHAQLLDEMMACADDADVRN